MVTALSDYTMQGVRYDIYEELGCYFASYISGATDLLFIIGNYFLPLVSLLAYTRELFFTASPEHYLNLIFGSKDTLGTLSAAKRGGAVPWQHGQEIST